MALSAHHGWSVGFLYLNALPPFCMLCFTFRPFALWSQKAIAAPDVMPFVQSGKEWKGSCGSPSSLPSGKEIWSESYTLPFMSQWPALDHKATHQREVRTRGICISSFCGGDRREEASEQLDSYPRNVRHTYILQTNPNIRSKLTPTL